jgi:hypothetical protein
MPVRNTLTRLRLALVKVRAFEEWPNPARSQRVLLELPFEIGNRSPVSMSIMD